MTDSDVSRALASKYSVERELGGGGMSRVFLAFDESLGRRIVVKVLHPELAATVNIERFRREIRVAAKLAHPHIVPLLNAGDADGLPFYTMPYIDGESLRERLKRDKQLSVSDATRIATEVANALDYAHRQGIVHRDITPGNILMQEGHAVVTDFGIARAVSQSANEGTLTQIGVTIGTPMYMSPEQIAGDAELDGRADVYSLGCVLYEMLAGAPPYGGDSMRALIAQHFSAPVPHVRAVRGEVSSGLESVIVWALAKEPSQRCESAARLAKEIQGAASAPRRDSMEGESIAVLGDRLSDATKSIVVLPFANLSTDADTEFFSDGLSEELITDLSRVGSLRVISRVSARQLKGTTKDLRTIGRELGVQYAVSGSVRRAGKDLRVTSQLVEIANDTELWAEKFGGSLDDVFDIQERLSRRIVDALKAKLTPEESKRLGARPIGNADAYACYLKAWHEVQSETESGALQAIQTAKRGLSLVGDNALLHGVMGHAHLSRALVATDQGPHLVEAERCAAAAKRADPDTAYPAFLKGLAQLLRGDIQSSVSHLKQALAIEPNHPDAMFWLIEAYVVTGQCDVARPLARRLAEIDPINPHSFCMPGFVEEMDGNFPAAIEPYQRMYDLSPQNPFYCWSYAFTIAWNGRIADACRVLGDVIRDAPTTFWANMARFRKPALEDDRAAALKAVTPDLIASAKCNVYWSWMFGQNFALIGENAQALDWLEAAARLGFINYPLLSQHDPLLAKVRGETRFEQLMKNVRTRWEAFES